MTTETPGGATGTMDRVQIEYINFDPEGSPVSIHMNPGVVDGIAHDVIESLAAEVGGLLLGRVVSGERPAVWIERYQRVACAHRFGLGFILDNEALAALEEAAMSVLDAGELAVVGLYRSHLRPGFQLEEPDFDLIRRYFNDSSDLILLIKPKGKSGISGQFHAWDERNGAHTVGGEFPFRGMADDAEKTRPHQSAAEIPATLAEAPRERPRRLVPDFEQTPVEPSPSMFGLSGPAEYAHTDELTVDRGTGGVRKWLPLLVAVLMVGAILWFVLRPEARRASIPAPVQTTEIARPLGLYVDPAARSWRVSWNPNATALHEARNVQLFVREKSQQGADDSAGDDQNRIDLSAQDLVSGSYQYHGPMGNDVTFRLEVTDQAGRVSAESFRLVRAANPPESASKPAPGPKPASPGTGEKSGTVQPTATYRAPAVVAAGVRSRIKGTIPIDVRVHIDTRGHVVSASSLTRQHSGLEEYLIARAVQAAKLWRFEPARDNGKPVAGTQILHFVFEK